MPLFRPEALRRAPSAPRGAGIERAGPRRPAVKRAGSRPAMKGHVRPPRSESTLTKAARRPGLNWVICGAPTIVRAWRRAPGSAPKVEQGACREMVRRGSWLRGRPEPRAATRPSGRRGRATAASARHGRREIARGRLCRVGIAVRVRGRPPLPSPDGGVSRAAAEGLPPICCMIIGHAHLGHSGMISSSCQTGPFRYIAPSKRANAGTSPLISQ
jgi:hypothetical protein